MKFGIDIGHNCPPDTGATGIKSEDSLVKDVGNRVIEKLKAAGHVVVKCNPEKAETVRHSLGQRVACSNEHAVEIFVSIHFNAFNFEAYGSEVFAISPVGKALGKKVLKEICSLGFFNRGVKDGSHLFVLKHTDAPAILIECAFCDSERDMKIFDAEKMASAITRGLIL
jgi:N-acetylmuramoyl-L-alanine amidase